MYRGLLFDLDGTLLTPELRLHRRVRSTLLQLMDTGLTVSFATGRPRRSVETIFDQLRPNAPVVCFNGAGVFVPGADGFLSLARLTQDAAVAAIAVSQARGVHANVYVDDTICVAASTSVAEASELKDGVPQRAVGDLLRFVAQLRRPPTKILFIAPPAELDGLKVAVRQAVGPRFGLVNSEPDYLELLPAGIDKRHGAQRALTAVGLGLSDIVAFGDGLNDLELLEHAGLSVAMQNAHPVIQQRADVIIGANHTDAIARFLTERFDLDPRRAALVPTTPTPNRSTPEIPGPTDE